MNCIIFAFQAWQTEINLPIFTMCQSVSRSSAPSLPLFMCHFTALFCGGSILPPSLLLFISMYSSAALFFAVKGKGQENPYSLRLDPLVFINGWSSSAGKESDFLKSE